MKTVVLLVSMLAATGCNPRPAKPAERSDSVAECRRFIAALGEPDALCYCPDTYDYCVVKLADYLVYADCGQGACTIIRMAGGEK